MASALAIAQAAVFTAFADAWASRTPIAWPNAPFTPPAKVWVKVDLTWADGVPSTMGPVAARRNSIAGLLTVGVYGPRDVGGKGVMDVADDVRDVFNRLTVDGVRFDVPSGPLPGADPALAGGVVRVTFSVDELV